jgi:hypothetical protein
MNVNLVDVAHMRKMHTQYTSEYLKGNGPWENSVFMDNN